MNLRNMILSALFAALTAICAWLYIPVLDISYTMQTFAIFLCLGVLGGKWGVVSIGTYLLLGAVGVPVFSGFQGGLSTLLGVTGGYIWGFLLSALGFWALEKVNQTVAMLAGLGLCYLCGSLWFLLYTGCGTEWILVKCVLPYLIPDMLKLTLARNLSQRIRRHRKW